MSNCILRLEVFCLRWYLVRTVMLGWRLALRFPASVQSEYLAREVRGAGSKGTLSQVGPGQVV